MRRLVLSVVLALAAPFAFAAQPTDAQVDRLLEVMRTRQQLEVTMQQIAPLQEKMMRDAIGDKVLTPAEQAKLDRVIAISRKAIADTMTWDKLEPVFRRIYAESFDSDDVDAMIGFYSSPAGQRLLEKTPLLAQKTMFAMQELMAPVMEQMQADIARELEAEAPKAGAVKAQ